ncbi:hypothetical protein ACIBI8_37035 [Streptomyces sp. NPDC050529]|uniref:hypothetical protein n=1 Tax=Streptomyces sp. NPDC050529 TaxID=3365624 RepID=UPI0037AD506A
MRLMRGVGVVAVGFAAVAVLSGCGGDTDDGAKPAASPSVSSVAVPEPEPTVEEPEYPATPAGDLDRLADEKGWPYDESLYESASEYVADICESMTAQEGFGTEPGEWLALRTDSDEADILKAGMPKLCPRWSKVALAALGGDYVRSYSDGTYTVKANPAAPDPGSDEDQEIGPGTYRTKGDLEDCYWERTTRSGEIIDNSFATSAQEITVTIRASDGQFTSRDCGSWKLVK